MCIRDSVYICSNPTYEGMVKIGMTTKRPRERVKDLYNTSVPTPFVLEHSFRITNTTPRAFEASCHKHLDKYRVNQRREFFYLSPEEARDKIGSMLEVRGRNNRVARFLSRFLLVALLIAVLLFSIRMSWPEIVLIVKGALYIPGWNYAIWFAVNRHAGSKQWKYHNESIVSKYDYMRRS